MKNSIRTSLVVGLLMSMFVITSVFAAPATTTVTTVKSVTVSTATFTGDWGVTTDGIIYIAVARVNEIADGATPEVRSELMVDANGDWISGIMMTKSGGYWVYNSSTTLSPGEPVAFGFMVSNKWVPGIYAKNRTLAHAIGFDWSTTTDNGRGSKNFVLPAVTK